MSDISKTKIQKTLSGEVVTPPPVWFLRQAGRYLPEYRAVRKSCGGFLDLCLNPELSCEVTMQPIRRFDFDAAILFSDILIIPHVLGQKLWFAEGEGPQLTPIQTEEEFERTLSLGSIDEKMAPVIETVRLIRRELPRDKSLIGFAGSPWTVATYMIAGRGKDDQRYAKAMLRDQPALFDRLMELLVEATVAYMSRQIDAGVDVVMLFDSWAAALSGDGPAFARYCYGLNRRIAETLVERHPAVKTIYFPRGATLAQLAEIIVDRAFHCVALGEDVDAADLAERVADAGGDRQACLQGNLDPAALSDPEADMAALVRDNLARFAGRPHIFNLGHGITPTGIIGHVETALATVRSAQATAAPQVV
ncbi:MAG: uroporphyrinogen decarboxylase [Rhodobacteraceae bacterium]|nr:MAG: uroporphyrinogen decarboxylase [Paracoccaceae bacterium]